MAKLIKKPTPSVVVVLVVLPIAIFFHMSPSPPPSSGCSLAVLVGGTSTAGSSNKFRHAILRNLLLRLSNKDGAASPSWSSAMSLRERRDAVRHAADAALAAARGAAPRWSRALAAELSSQSQSQQHGRWHWHDDDAPHLLVAGADARPSGHQTCLPCGTAAAVAAAGCRKTVPRRRRLRVRARPKSGATTAWSAGAVARVVARRRARAGALRRMVPGGRGMADECTLLGETLDYAVSLRAQVDAMQLLLRTLQPPGHANNNP